MHAWLETSESATVKLLPSIGTRKSTEYSLVIRDNDLLFASSAVTIEASGDLLVSMAKTILRQIEPSALAAERREAAE